MKNITKLILGTGIVGAALLGAVAPATAASPQADGDRVTGIASFGTTTGGVELFSSAPNNGYNPSPVFVTTGPAAGDRPESAWTFPAAGTEGPIGATASDDGKCIQTDTYGSTTWRACDGSPSQQFKLSSVVVGGIHGSAIESVSRPGSYLSLIGGLQGMMGLTGLTGSTALFQNYDDLTPIAAVTPVDVTGPAAGSTVTTPNPTFSGTGEPGATIVIKDETGAELCTTTVATDGTWACASSIALADGSHTITAEQTAEDGSKTTDTVTFIVADENPGSPIVAPAIAALAALGLGAGALIKRRKN